MTGIDLERRQCIKTILAGTALSAASFIFYRTGFMGRFFDRHLLTMQMESFFRHPGSARVIGKAYLAEFPAERNLEKLVSRLGLSSIRNGRINSNAGNRREAIRKKIRDDFESGHTVQLTGWFLSRSEARFCAVLSMLSRP